MEVLYHMDKQSSYRDVLSIPSFRFLWFGQVFSQLAVNTLLFVLALRLYQTTGTNTAVTGLFLAYGVPAVLFGMVAGTAVDHLDKRRVLVYCDLIRAVLVFFLLFLSGNIFLVYLVTLVNAVITQFYVPAEAPIIPHLVNGKNLVPANSLFSLTYYSSLAIGSVLAGPLFLLLGTHWIFVVLSLFFAAAALLESKLP
jgi:predicted MFS family arabinose efflux permease